VRIKFFKIEESLPWGVWDISCWSKCCIGCHGSNVTHSDSNYVVDGWNEVCLIIIILKWKKRKGANSCFDKSENVMTFFQ